MQVSREKLDQWGDYVPFVSLVSNVYNLYEHIFVLPKLNSTEILKNRHYTQLKIEGATRCFIAALPFAGNLIIGIMDFVRKKSNDPDYMLKRVQDHGFKELQKLGFYLRNNKEFIGQLCGLAKDREDGGKILHIIGNLPRNDIQFLEQLPLLDALRIAGDAALNNAEFMARLYLWTGENGKVDVLNKVGNQLKDNIEFLKQLSSLDALKIAGDAALNNAEFMARLYLWTGENDKVDVLNKVGNQLKNNLTFMRSVIDSYVDEPSIDWVLNNMSVELSNHSPFIQELLSACKWNKKVLDKIGPVLRNDKSFIQALVNHPSIYTIGDVLPIFGNDLKNDTKYIKDLIEEYPTKLSAIVTFAGDTLKNDRSFVFWYLEKIRTLNLSDPHFFYEAVLAVVGDNLQNDLNFFNEIFKFFDAQKMPGGLPDYVFKVLGTKWRNDRNLFESLLTKSMFPQVEYILAVVGDNLKKDIGFRRFLSNKYSEKTLNQYGIKVT